MDTLKSLIEGLGEIVAHLKSGRVAVATVLSIVVLISPLIGADEEIAQQLVDALLTNYDAGVGIGQALLAFLQTNATAFSLIVLWLPTLMSINKRGVDV